MKREKIKKGYVQKFSIRDIDLFMNTEKKEFLFFFQAASFHETKWGKKKKSSYSSLAECRYSVNQEVQQISKCLRYIDN